MQTRNRTILLLVALAGALVHLSLLFISLTPRSRLPIGDERMYLDQARLIATGAEWSPHPFWPHLYFYFLAGIFVIGGNQIIVQFMQTFMLVISAIILSDITFCISGSRAASLIAGWLTLSYPPLIAFAHFYWPEVLHILLFLSVLWILVRRNTKITWICGAGLLLGLAVSAKFILAPFVPVLLLGCAAKKPLRQRLITVATASAALLCTLIVFAPRNQHDLKVRLLSCPLFNIWVGLNDSSLRSFKDDIAGLEYMRYMQSAQEYSERNAILFRKIQGMTRSKGIFQIACDQFKRQYVRLFDKDSFFTDQLPFGEKSVSGQQGYVAPNLLLSQALRWLSYAFFSFILVGFIVGIAVVRPENRWWLYTVVAFLAYNLIIFLLLHVKSRYRVQMLPFLFPYVGCAGAWLGQKLHILQERTAHWRESISVKAWVGVGMGSALLLFLAWGRPLLE